MDIITILGLLSGIIGIIGFFFPVEWKDKNIIKITFTIIFIFLSSFIVYQNSKLNKIEKVSKSANILIQQKSTSFTYEGFILASLSFLEQNKIEYPESYERAKKIFENYDRSENRETQSVSTSSEMEGLIRGIAILSTVEGK